MMTRPRGLDKRFLDEMRRKLEIGRQHYVGWDQHWLDCSFHRNPTGPRGSLMSHLQDEVTELILALHEGDKDKVKEEAADVANFAMMVADFHGALDE